MEKLNNLLSDKTKLRHYILYVVFGVFTTLVNFLTFFLLDKFIPILNENISNMIAILIAILFSYFTNREYVFKSQETNKIKEFSKFFVGRMSSTIFDIVAFWILTSFTTLNELLIKALISVVVLILNYIISKVFVFRKGSSK